MTGLGKFRTFYAEIEEKLSSFAKIVMGSSTLLLVTLLKKVHFRRLRRPSIFVVRSKSQENSLVADVLEYNWRTFTEQGVAIYVLM